MWERFQNWLARRRQENFDVMKHRAEVEARLDLLAWGLDPDAPGPQGPAGVQGPKGVDGGPVRPVD